MCLIMIVGNSYSFTEISLFPLVNGEVHKNTSMNHFFATANIDTHVRRLDINLHHNSESRRKMILRCECDWQIQLMSRIGGMSFNLESGSI